VPEFLSVEWIDALDAAAQAATLPESAAEVSFTVEQVVRDAPGGEVRYHLRLEGGRARIRRGPADAPDLRLFAGYDIAARLQRGELSAQRALAAGDLKVQGRLQRLVQAGDALQALEDLFAPVRADTTYGKSPAER
jgi:hypothetical protein